eukprot:18253-Heterococcus_DN1.PRE.1
MLMGSVLDSSSAATTAAATSESEQQQQLATLALAEAHSMRNGTTAASTSAAPSHGGPTAAATAATATAVEESTDRWSLKNVNRVQFKPAGTLQLLWQTHSDLDIFAAKDLQEFALASDALQLADSSSSHRTLLVSAATTTKRLQASALAALLVYTALFFIVVVHRQAKFSYTNYAGKFTVASGELSPGGRRHDTFTTHKATGKNKYRLPMNMNFTAKPKAAKMGPARVASAASIEEGNCDDYDDTNATTNNNANISTAFPGERSSVLQALGQRWRALLGAATVSSSGAAKRRRSSLKPFLSHAGDAPQSPTAAAATQRSARVSVQEHPRTHNSNGTSSRSSGSAQGFTALVPLSPVAAAPVAAAAVALAPI